MKKIITLFFTFSMILFSFSQSNATFKMNKHVEKTIKLNTIEQSTNSRSIDCIWESDFSDASQWSTEHDASDCSLDWEIGYNLTMGGFFPISDINSEDGYYAMVDSDEYGGEEGGTEVEDSWLTMTTSVDLSAYDNVIVEFDSWYRRYNNERCFVVVSTDGTFPSDLTPTTEADPANGIYPVFTDMENVTSLAENPTTTRVNISEAAGGQDQVWIRFNWTGTWGYAWFIDNVCIAQQPADDITLSYGVVTHNGTSEEYGRVPKDQIGDDITVGAGVYNFGVNAQDNVSVTMSITDIDGAEAASSYDFNSQIYNADTGEYEDVSGSMASDANWYFNTTTAPLETGLYSASFTASSDGDGDGGEFSNDNSRTREFAITDMEYSIDGIDVYTTDASTTRLGTGSFTDASDGFIMMTYYDLSNSADIAGARIMLDSYMYSSPLTVAGGELVVSLKDTLGIAEGTTFDPTSGIYAQSDFYLLTQADVDLGYVDVGFSESYSADPGAYMLTVEMYSNGNENDMYILDDTTVPQPAYCSMIYIPGDQAYTNGTAAGIRMLLGNSVGTAEDLNNLSIYPNPSNGIINIELDKNNEYQLTVNDVLGKIVSRETISSSKTLDVQHLQKGVYFINISNTEMTKTAKVIIE